MRTGGYDVLVEVGQGLVSKALAAAFRTSSMPRVKGTIIPKSSVPLSGLASVDYEVWPIEAPTVTFLMPDMLRARSSMAVELTGPLGVKGSFQATANVVMRVSLDGCGRLTLQAVRAEVEDVRPLGSCRQSRLATLLADEAVTAAVRSPLVASWAARSMPGAFSAPRHVKGASLSGDVQAEVTLKPLGLRLLVPPMMIPSMDEDGRECDVPAAQIAAGHLELVNSGCMAAAISFQEETAGDPRGIKDFTGGHDLAVGLSEASIRRILDHSWPAMPRMYRESGRAEVEDVRELVGLLRGAFDLPSRLARLGLGRRSVRADRGWVDYSLYVVPEKPDVRLSSNGVIEVSNTSMDVHAVASVRASLVATEYSGIVHRSADAVDVEERTVELYNFDQLLHVDLIRAEMRLYAERGRLMVRAVDVDFEMERLGRSSGPPQFLLDMLTNRIERMIESGMPPMDLTGMLEKKLAGRDPLRSDLIVRSVSSEEDELIIAADVLFRDVPDGPMPVPAYIVDARGGRAHLASCPHLARVREADKIGYATLAGALARCPGAEDCLAAYAPESGATLAPDRYADLTGIEERGRQRIDAWERQVSKRLGEMASQDVGHGGYDEVQRERGQQGGGGAVQDPGPVPAPEGPCPIDREADEDEPCGVAGEMDGDERGHDPPAESGPHDDERCAHGGPPQQEVRVRQR